MANNLVFQEIFDGGSNTGGNTGGESGGGGVELDATLTQEGKAADAKATGGAIAQCAKKTDLKEYATEGYVDAEIADALSNIGASGGGGLSIKKIEFTDRPTLYAWLQENAGKFLQGFFVHATMQAPLRCTHLSVTNATSEAFYTLTSIKAEPYMNNSDIDHIIIRASIYEIHNDKTQIYESVAEEGWGGNANTVPDEYWAYLAVRVTIYYIE